MLVWERMWHELAREMRLAKPPLAPLLASSAKRLHAGRTAETTLSCLGVLGCLLHNSHNDSTCARASTTSAVELLNEPSEQSVLRVYQYNVSGVANFWCRADFTTFWRAKNLIE